MKLLILSLFVSSSVFANTDKVVVKPSKVASFVCERVYNSFNVPACVEKFEECIDYTMSFRIADPSDLGVRYIWAVNSCMRTFERN
jgi:hypothetical protein